MGISFWGAGFVFGALVFQFYPFNCSCWSERRLEEP